MLATLDDHDLDNGPRTTRSGTARMCAVTRKVRPIDELIRFVLDGSGQVVPDVKRKLPGRGLWVSASRQAVAAAVKRQLFAKGFRRPVKDQETLVAETDALLAKSAIEALAIAAKAGQVVSGFAKVEAGLKAGEVKALIHARDGAADGIRKLDNLAAAASARGNAEIAGKMPVINALSSAELDLALSRSNVIHAALLAGPAGKTFLSRIEQLVRFRTGDGGETANENSGTTARASAL
jgi:predicted RNA-binding protein YlxR (DUF448 family)